jgi:hypothetical protein
MVNTNSVPYIDQKYFNNLCPIFSVELSNQPKKLFDVKSNTILHADFNKYIPEPTGTNEGRVCFIIAVSKYLLVYEPAKKYNYR